MAKYIGTGFVKGSELLRVYLDLHLEPGQYVEIKDSGQREAKFRQVATRDIGKSGKDFPAYAGYIDFQIRSNFDLNLATKRYTRGSFFEHDKWDAYFTGPDTIIGNGRFSPTTLCASTWRVKLYKSVAADVDIIPSLVAVIIKPSNQPQEPSTEDKPAGTAAEQSDVHVEGEASESPVWVTFLPKSPIRSLKEYSHTYRTSPPPAPPLYKPVPMPDCELEIRRAADQTRVARIPHGGSFGVNGFTKQARQRIGQLPDGEYLLAFCAGDKRCSNVAILVLDSDYDPSREPTLGLIPLPMGPGQTLPLFGIRAVGPTPQDSQLMNDSIAFPTLVVDGMERTLSQMTWVGPVGPLKSGGVYTRILTLDDYEPAIKSGRKHTIKAVVGKYESTRVVIPADDILGRQWDKSTENQPPIQPPKVVLQGGVIRSDGKIGAGYEVHIFGQNGERYNAFSDKDGKYSFSNIPSGEYKVVCNPKGKGQPGLTIESVMVNPNKTLILNLGLERKYSFAGRIRYEDGKPATGIDVALTCQDTDTNAEFINFTITDVNGNYELGGPFGNVSYIGINGRRIRGTMPKLKPGITELYYVLKKNAQGKYIGLPAERPTEIPGVQVDEEKSAEDRSEFESAEIEPNEPMVSLNFRNVDLKTIIAKLADWTGKTIIPTAEATKLKMTTYAPKKMPQSKAVALILTALRIKGCVVEETDYAIVILRMPEEDPGKASTGSDESATEGIDKSQVVQKFYRLQNYSPTEMGRTIKPLLSNAGKQRADEESSTLLIIDTVENLERIEKTIEQLDKPETRQFPIFVGEKEYEIVQLGYADVNEVTERLNQAIQQMPDKEMRQKVLVQPLPRAKQIIIFGREDLREMVKKLIMEIDIPSRLFETRVFKLKYANADRIKENIEAIYEPLTDGVKAISYPEMHQVTVIASSGNMLKVADKIAEWDVPLDLDRLKPRIITLRNSDPAQMAELLTSTFAGEGGGEGDIYEVIFGKDILEKRKTTGPLSYQLNFEGVPGTRKIIVISNFPEAYDVVEKLILELDKQKMATKNVKQVRQWIDRLAGEGRLGGSKTSDHKILIETRILSVTDDFLEEIELDANSVRTSEMWSEYLLADSTAEPNSPQYQLLLDELSAGLLTKAVATHKGTGKGNEMLATPQVIAADGKQAIIKVVNLMATEKPVVAGPSDTNDLSSKAESKLKFVEVGTSIRLTPDVLPDGGNVRLDFEWELSQVRGFEERTGPDKKKLKVPLLAVDTIKTTTVVPDGKTLLIGGKKISRWTLTESRKPILGDLPLVGYIFRSDSMIEDTKNILILVKPAIVQPKPTASPPIPPLEPDDPLPKKLQEKLESPTAPK